MPEQLPLFSRYPVLGSRLPHVSLGSLPTPVREFTEIGAGNDCRLFFKDDGLSGDLYGGNKVRKLEFLLGEALRRKSAEVITYGYAGSNHALATALYAQRCGLDCTLMLMPQLNAEYVRRNLLRDYAAGAKIEHYPSASAMYWPTFRRLVTGRVRKGKSPFIVPAGGSSPLGAVGCVNAAFELKGQIEAGDLPEPDLLYVAFGTMGTAAGLAVGLTAAGLKTRIVAVRVVDARWANMKKFGKLVKGTVDYLRSIDPSFPSSDRAGAAVTERTGFFGGEYARFTDEGISAGRLFRQSQGVELDGTYTAKAMAALLADLGGGKGAGKDLLFWNTCNARDFSEKIAPVDYRDLPSPFHRYFRTETQRA